MRRMILLHIFAVALFAHLLVDAQTMQYSLRLQDYGFAPILHPKPGAEGDTAMTHHIAVDSQGRVYVGFPIEGGPKLLQQGGEQYLPRIDDQL